MSKKGLQRGYFGDRNNPDFQRTIFEGLARGAEKSGNIQEARELHIRAISFIIDGRYVIGGNIYHVTGGQCSPRLARDLDAYLDALNKSGPSQAYGHW